MAVTESREVLIEATPDEIMEVLFDLESLTEWSSAHRKVEILERDDQGRQTDLIRLLDSDAATMTRTTQRLEHAGFVRRSPCADDKRAYLIEPTAAGRALRPQVEQIWNQLEGIVVGGVGERERQTIRRVLEGLEERLTHAAESRV
jgi:DNA-binding MarR family transcriptional regulator